MLYLSEIINRPVRDRYNTEMARIMDVVVKAPTADTDCPQLHGLVARAERGGSGFFLPIDRVGAFGPNGVSLTSAAVALETFERRPGELLLAKDVWDRRVIDPATRQVHRVNDVVLGLPGEIDAPQKAPPEGVALADLMALGVDVGVGGILRRLGLYKLLGGRVKTVLLPWEDVELLTGNKQQAQDHYENLAQMHPVDIAALTERVSNSEAAEILSGLDDDVAADVLEELPAERQLDIMEYLDDERAADIIEEMAPDDASDLLGDLSDERAANLLDQMEPEAVSSMRPLLAYHDNTAGGMMTTSFVRVPDTFSVAQTIAALRQDVEKPNLVFYVYVVDNMDDNHLLGVVTLRNLLIAEPDTQISAIMRAKLVATDPAEEDREVARKMAEYNLIAIPVIDDENHLLGIVTVDDALDVLLPSGWQRHMPRIFN